jgi:two-component system chemotaxis response regulator CheY
MMNILVVDDSPLTRKAVRRILGMIPLDLGAVYEAENGDDALRIMTHHSVDLVLADLNMPGMPGMEMIAQMRKNDLLKSIPVIVVSTEASVKRIDALRRDGVLDYLHKPFTPEQLKVVIERTLEVLSHASCE